MNQLEVLRESLGQCDEIILDALLMRNRIVEDIMVYKEANDLPVLQPEQEAKQKGWLEARMEGRRHKKEVNDVFASITQNSKRIQSRNLFNYNIFLIGFMGAGKSTMVDILLGLLKPQYGKIYADDMNIQKNILTWQKEIGYIPQTIYLSDDTIRNNVAFGVPEDQINEQAVQHALEQAQLSEFIDSLPAGLDTFVGDRGVRLSGGQRQRIGIARALYHDPEILVLDEATSALDTETETAVMKAIDSLQGQKTILVIAHRLTTIKKADRFFEVANGQVIERTKQEVLK